MPLDLRQASRTQGETSGSGGEICELGLPLPPKPEDGALRREGRLLSQRPLGVVVPRGGRFDGGGRLSALRTPSPAGPRGLGCSLFLFGGGEALLRQVERIWERVAAFSLTSRSLRSWPTQVRLVPWSCKISPRDRAEGIKGSGGNRWACCGAGCHRGSSLVKRVGTVAFWGSGEAKAGDWGGHYGGAARVLSGL